MAESLDAWLALWNSKTKEQWIQASDDDWTELVLSWRGELFQDSQQKKEISDKLDEVRNTRADLRRSRLEAELAEERKQRETHRISLQAQGWCAHRIESYVAGSARLGGVKLCPACQFVENQGNVPDYVKCVSLF